KKLSSKLVSISDALSPVRDQSVVAISGFNMAATPEHLILSLFEMYQKTGHPKNLFLICDSLPAIPGRALDYVSEQIYRKKDEGFLRGMLIPFLGFSPWAQKIVEENMLETYSWPIGVVAYWFREVASGRPGLITTIGIDTLLDPRKEGGAMNRKADQEKTCKVNLVQIEGNEFLFYNAPKPTFALIRASVSDESGNLSMTDEGIRGTVLNIAQATKARPEPGSVVAQVRWITKSGTMNPRDVDVPSPLIDTVVLSPKQHHWQGGTFEYDPRISYRVMQPVTEEIVSDILPPPEREFERVIARRVLVELMKVLEEKNSPVLVNLGVGIPALVSAVAAEENVTDCILSVLESGPWGGIALSGVDFGLAFSPFALSSMPDMFSNFEGGIIDAASLGFLQIDSMGNVNPSMLPGRIYGPGGFPVIAGGAPRTYFSGAFTGGQTKLRVESGTLKIIQDGPVDKFVSQVYRVFFSGKEAIKHGKEILYITERAVFRLTKDSVLLEEIAPGVDLDKHVLRKMEFKPEVSPKLREMDRMLFLKQKMGLRETLFAE
ncbi:MAG TPA: CoA-transferase, partial [Nitrososphaerales archaeon]|nr:CoA-transferase [Nitrososphaerales archaeon]